jgi:hypothetical protein
MTEITFSSDDGARLEATQGLVLLSPAGQPADYSSPAGKADRTLVCCSRGEFAFRNSETVAAELPVPTEKLAFAGRAHAQVMLKDGAIADALRRRILTFLRAGAGAGVSGALGG